jgi:hypothetical protein
MKKIINEKKGVITYFGKITELKNQLKYLMEVHSQFKYMLNEIDFKKLPVQDFPLQTMNERLTYNNKKIIYGPNGFFQPYKFLNIKHYSDLADKKFVKQYGKESLEIILEEK